MQLYLITDCYIINYIIFSILFSLLLIIPIIVSIAFFTLAERKIMASIQRRKGPNVVGFFGLLQPFADGLKALLKEVVIPYQSNRFIFIIAPCLTFVISILNWAIIPFNYSEVISDLNYGLLYLYAFSSLSVYSIILAGWVSRSKYPFLGAIRSAAQMISYEVAIGIIFVIIVLCSHSLNLIDIVYTQEKAVWFLFPLFPIAGIFLVTIIAETNRAPFDIPEAEAEIVAGYNLEYSSIIFAFFFLGEYGNILMMSTIYSIIFIGGWLPVFGIYVSIFNLQIKTVLVCFIFVIVRATLPRYRYDQIMEICWHIYLPFSLLYIVTIMGIFIYCVY